MTYMYKHQGRSIYISIYFLNGFVFLRDLDFYINTFLTVYFWLRRKQQLANCGKWEQVMLLNSFTCVSFFLGSALGFVWVPSQVCVGAAICKIWFWLHMHNGYSVVCGPCEI